MTDTISVDVEDGVATLTLRRPRVLNALDSHTHRAIAAAFEELERDERVGAIVIAAEGRAFCSGSDLREIGQLAGRAEQEYVELDFRTKNRIATCPKPVIAAIQGYCVGGGLELALACDLRVAATDAIFSMPEVSLGSLPGSGGLQRLPQVVGVGIAKEWILTGRRVPAEEAAGGRARTGLRAGGQEPPRTATREGRAHPRPPRRSRPRRGVPDARRRRDALAAVVLVCDAKVLRSCRPRDGQSPTVTRSSGRTTPRERAR
jgi:hypothetical protein